MTTKKKKTKQTVWAYETMDPKVLWWLDQHDRGTEIDAAGKKRKFARVKPGVNRWELQKVEAELYEAIKKLCRATLRAYKKAKSSDIEDMLDDLTSSVMMTFRLYFDPDRGKIFTLLVFIIKTQYSHHYKGIFASSSFYDTNKHEKLELKRIKTIDEEDMAIVIEELQAEAEALGEGHSVTKCGRHVILYATNKHYMGGLSPVIAEKGKHRQFSEFDAIDVPAISEYVSDVVAAPKHQRIAHLLLDYASDLLNDREIVSTNRQLLPLLRKKCETELGEPVRISDVKLGIRVVRVARQYQLEEETAYTENFEEDFLLHSIDGGY